MQNGLNFVKNSHMLRRNEPMNTSDFWYDLPEELIAQTPLGQRDASRMLHLDPKTGEIKLREILSNLTLYTEPEYYRFVLEYIIHHAPEARMK